MRGKDIYEPHTDDCTESEEKEVEENEARRRRLIDDGGYKHFGRDRPEVAANAQCCFTERLEEERLLKDDVKLLEIVRFGPTITERNEILELTRRRLQRIINMTEKGSTEGCNGMSATNCGEEEAGKEGSLGKEADMEKTEKSCEINVKETNGCYWKIEKEACFDNET